MAEEGYTPLVIHALYYLAEAAGWRSGLRWQLLTRGVYSVELQRLLVAGRAPRPPREAVERVRRFIRIACRGDGGNCGLIVVAAAKIAAYRRLDMRYEDSHVVPRWLISRITRALEEAGIPPRTETIITPAALA